METATASCAVRTRQMTMLNTRHPTPLNDHQVTVPNTAGTAISRLSPISGVASFRRSRLVPAEGDVCRLNCR
ncbi:hypothetical protein GA0070607_5090 [Micromonospora coriariae]|uniref:Uncharacterized protein n=1 Tax=Micromonospora coriariae TaxID=285665 RepID=A0A1C4XDQ8_9ACTN|nr:hypothetical protein GA0070607_5090 [Micromonospora coriariae]